MEQKDILLSLRNLSVQYKTRAGLLGAVSNVNLDVRRGEVLGLVGESGCGKSTLGKAIMRLIRRPGRITGGEMFFDGVDLMTLNEEEMRDMRGRRIAMIFQDPMTSLNPVQRILDHFVETVQAHDASVAMEIANMRAEEIIENLRITADRLNDYPHQLSGGMRQRVMIGLGMALNANLIIADEATTSLDVLVEAQFLELLRELCRQFDLTVILITHNIGIVAELADRVAVMYAGKIIELGDVYEVFGSPQHPYTQGLLQSVPNIKLQDQDLYKMGGSPPDLITPPEGCRFHPRCPRVMDVCSQREPGFLPAQPDHYTACWLYEPHDDILTSQAVTSDQAEST
jgi:oligopeptide/dipeptide ABC transporter ATP-binding protein